MVIETFLLGIRLLNCNQVQAFSNVDLLPYMPVFIAIIAGGVALYNVNQNILLQYKVKQVELIRESASKYFTLIGNLKVIALNALYEIKNETDPVKRKEIWDADYKVYITAATEAANYENLIKLQLQKDNPIHDKAGKYMEEITKELEAIRTEKSADEGKLKSDLGKLGDVLVSIFKEKLGKNY